MLDLNLPKNSYVFLCKHLEEGIYQVPAVFASDVLKRNTDFLRCAFLFGIMSRRVNYSQYDKPIANLAECGTHDAQPSFQLKRDLYFSLEVVHYLQVSE